MTTGHYISSSVVAALLMAGCTSPPERPEAMHTLPECGWLPNCVNSESGRGAQSSEPVSASAEQWEGLKAWVTKQQDWEVTINEDNFIQAVVKTPLMRFRDDVQMLFIPDQQLIQVRSSSRLGISDLGTNARRVELLRQQLKD
jgi:uncharacterized protein (DUF1499 family)